MCIKTLPLPFPSAFCQKQKKKNFFELTEAAESAVVHFGKISKSKTTNGIENDTKLKIYWAFELSSPLF